jgi:enoyl-CoA hydratase/carnithine racemase
MIELTQVLDRLEADDSVAAVVLTGSEKAFAAGADIKGARTCAGMDCGVQVVEAARRHLDRTPDSAVTQER